MTEEQPPRDIHETTPERVRRVAGKPLKAEPANRWLLLVGFTLVFLVGIILGIGLVVGLGAAGIFSRYTEQIESLEDDAPTEP
jgi:hypothetical protein